MTGQDNKTLVVFHRKSCPIIAYHSVYQLPAVCIYNNLTFIKFITMNRKKKIVELVY